MDNTAPIIGKDVIESLTLSMYDDSKFIYREYIQNSADQIDKAIASELISQGDGEIYIDIDKDKRRIEIYDNATGIEQSKVLPILQNVAQSTKERGVDKGFRGIGRLGGLGYCSKLIFETSAKGENVKSIMAWDAQLFKEIINNRTTKENASIVIQQITSLKVEEEKVEEHYFKVVLEGVSNGELLDDAVIRDYLCMVAPVDYPNAFIYHSMIDNYVISNNLPIDCYKIYLNGEIIQKQYTTSIYKQKEKKKEKIDDILDLVFFDKKANDGKQLYWGWYTLSSSKGQMTQVNKARGIRLRKANIQLGSDEALSRFFPKGEDRWNYYFFGEVHAVHPELIPNARRDYFSENETCKEFEKELRLQLKSLYDLTYAASNINSNDKRIQEAKDFEDTIKHKEEIGGFKSKEERQDLYAQLEDKQAKAEKSRKEIERIRSKAQDAGLPIDKIINSITTNKDVKLEDLSRNAEIKKTKFITDAPQYSSIPKNERKLIGRIYAIIGNILPKETSDLVIKKIEEELTK